MENLIVPDDLSHKARWARAQGHGGVIASHPNAVAAVRAIGADGSIRDHLFSALWHLAHANPMPIGAAIGVDNHAVMLVGKLEELIKQFETEIATSLKAYGARNGRRLWIFPEERDRYRGLVHRTHRQRRPGTFAQDHQAGPCRRGPVAIAARGGARGYLRARRRHHRAGNQRRDLAGGPARQPQVDRDSARQR